MSLKRILLLSHLKIQNANALSSPYTIGFPAMTAWLGAAHALQRKLNQSGYEALCCKSVAVVCHNIDLQTYKGPGDFVNSIIGTGNPLDKDGKRPAFIEEARCHLDVSLVIECEGTGPFGQEELLSKVNQKIQTGLKFAGGDLIDFSGTELTTVDGEQDLQQLTRKLMPGYVLIERRDLLIAAIQEKQNKPQDTLDALLDCLTVKHRSEVDDDGNITWNSTRKQAGWIVPIATGFQGITPLLTAGETKNQRDPDTSHRFAESIVTLGEFVMPYRIRHIDNMLWHYHLDAKNDLYVCQPNNLKTTALHN